MKKERGGYERRGFDAVYLPPEVERNPAARNRRLNLFGGKLALIYNNGTREIVSLEEEMIQIYNPNRLGEQEVRVSEPVIPRL